MATVSGQGTTFVLPNYTGDLYTVAPSDAPLLSSIGGLNGGVSVPAVEFEWQTEDLEATSVNNAVVEGATAPTASGVSRSNVNNVVEIHHEAVEITYTKQWAVAQHAGINTEGTNPIRDELARQIDLKLKKIAVDVEKSFLSGVYAKPVNNATPRKTRGLLTAITTNVFANGGTPRALSKSIVDNALSAMFAAGSPLNNDNTVLLVGPAAKITLSNLYLAAQLNVPSPSRNIGGVAIDTIITDFGTFGVMLDRWMPAGGVAVVDLSVLRPRYLGPGFVVEELAKVGSSRKFQLYGEIGLEYGPEVYHGYIKDLS